MPREVLTRTNSLFLKILTTWTARLALAFKDEDPLLLLRLLDTVDEADGISQSALAKKLGVKQSRLSKLVKKLIAEDYVRATEVREDRRMQVLRSTACGNGVLYHLELVLSERLVTAYSTELLIARSAPAKYIPTGKA